MQKVFKQNWSKVLSLLTALLGTVLLVFMITTEGELGALPLLLIIIGTVWFIISQNNKEQLHSVIKKSPILLLKTTLVFMGLVVLALAVFAMPKLYKGALAEFPYASNAILGIFIVLYAVAIPFLIVLLQSWKLLVLIDQNKGFSKLTVKAFRNIKNATLFAGILLMIGFVPLLYPIAEEDDAPGLLIYGFLFACIPFVVSVFAAVLQKLFQNAVDLKSENDLTI